MFDLMMLLSIDRLSLLLLRDPVEIPSSSGTLLSSLPKSVVNEIAAYLTPVRRDLPQFTLWLHY